MSELVAGTRTAYWTIAAEDLVKVEANRYGRFPGHAGTFETSLALALRPELVREPRPHRDDAGTDLASAKNYRLERHGSWQKIDGFTDSPDRGTAELGRLYLTTVAEAVGRALVDFYVATGGQLEG